MTRARKIENARSRPEPGILGARERTTRITRAAVGWLVKRRYSCYLELGVLPSGARRCDLVALNTSRDIVIVEVKQSWTDFANDRKWQQYLAFCNRFYFALPEDVFTARELDIVSRVGRATGILVLGRDGLARVVKNAQHRPMESAIVRDIVTRLAWRGGISRRTTRRTRVYL